MTKKLALTGLLLLAPTAIAAASASCTSRAA